MGSPLDDRAAQVRFREAIRWNITITTTGGTGAFRIHNGP